MPYREKTSLFTRFENVGELVAGVYQGNEAITLTNGNIAYRHAVRQEDGSEISFLGGTILDQILGDIPIGQRILIERTGTTKTASRRDMKAFRVSIWEDEPIPS